MMSPVASTRRFFVDKMSSESAAGSPATRRPPKLWPDAAAGKVGSVKVWKCLALCLRIEFWAFPNVSTHYKSALQHDGPTASYDSTYHAVPVPYSSHLDLCHIFCMKHMFSSLAIASCLSAARSRSRNMLYGTVRTEYSFQYSHVGV